MKTVRLLLALLFVFTLAMPSQATEQVKVDVLFMNHGPLRTTLNNMQSVFAKYEGKISVAWHDFETDEGQAFMSSKGLNEHIPLMVWINGNVNQKIDGEDVAFRGFPTGAGPAFFQGKWNMELLDKVLNQASR